MSKTIVTLTLLIFSITVFADDTEVEGPSLEPVIGNSNVSFSNEDDVTIKWDCPEETIYEHNRIFVSFENSFNCEILRNDEEVTLNFRNGNKLLVTDTVKADLIEASTCHFCDGMFTVFWDTGLRKINLKVYKYDKNSSELIFERNMETMPEFRDVNGDGIDEMLVLKTAWIDDSTETQGKKKTETVERYMYVDGTIEKIDKVPWEYRYSFIHENETDEDLEQLILSSKDIPEFRMKWKVFSEKSQIYIFDVPDLLMAAIIENPERERAWKAFHRFRDFTDGGISLTYDQICAEVLREDKLLFWKRYMSGDDEALFRMKNAFEGDFGAFLTREDNLVEEYKSWEEFFESVLQSLNDKSRSGEFYEKEAFYKRHTNFLDITTLAFQRWKERYEDLVKSETQ